MNANTDSLQRFLFEGAPVRGEIVHLDSTWRAVLERHRYPAPLRAVLGQLMAAAALLSLHGMHVAAKSLLAFATRVVFAFVLPAIGA